MTTPRQPQPAGRRGDSIEELASCDHPGTDGVAADARIVRESGTARIPEADASTVTVYVPGVPVTDVPIPVAATPNMTERGIGLLFGNTVLPSAGARVSRTSRSGLVAAGVAIDDQSVTHAEARVLIADRWEIPADVRARRRSKKMGKTPQQVLEAHVKSDARRVDERGDLPTTSSRPNNTRVKQRTA